MSEPRSIQSQYMDEDERKRAMIKKSKSLRKDVQSIVKGQVPKEVDQDMRKDAEDKNQNYTDYYTLLKEKQDAEEQFYQNQHNLKLALIGERPTHDVKKTFIDLFEQQEQFKQELKAEYEREKFPDLQTLDPIGKYHLRRLPMDEQETAERYVERKRNIYNKLKDTEVRDMYLQMKRKYDKYDATKYTSNKREFYNLYEKHLKVKQNYYENQPYVEEIRQELLYDLGRCHTMLSCLKNLEDSRKGQYSASGQFSVDEKELEKEINKEYKAQHSRDPSSMEQFKTKEEIKEDIKRKFIEKKKLEMEARLGNKMKEEQELGIQRIDLNSNIPYKDIDKPKIWNWQRNQLLIDDYADDVAEYLKKKQAIYENKDAQIFEDEGIDYTKKVQHYLEEQQLKSGVKIDNDYYDLLPEKINYQYYD